MAFRVQRLSVVSVVKEKDALKHKWLNLMFNTQKEQKVNTP